jgi:hypothetical protein
MIDYSANFVDLSYRPVAFEIGVGTIVGIRAVRCSETWFLPGLSTFALAIGEGD